MRRAPWRIEPIGEHYVVRRGGEFFHPENERYTLEAAKIILFNAKDAAEEEFEAVDKEDDE